MPLEMLLEMPRGSSDRFDELSLRYLDGLLTDEEYCEFTGRLRHDESSRDLFVGLCVQTSLLMEEEQAEEDISACCAVNRSPLTAAVNRRAVQFPLRGLTDGLSTPQPPLGFLQSVTLWATSVWRKISSTS